MANGSPEVCPIKPPRPDVDTTRWQGINIGTGFLRQALPTARGELPSCFAMSPYVLVFPGFMEDSICQTLFWTSVPASTVSGCKSSAGKPAHDLEHIDDCR